MNTTHQMDRMSTPETATAVASPQIPARPGASRLPEREVATGVLAPTSKDIAVLAALGINTEAPQPHVVAAVRASLARPKAPKVITVRRHGHDIKVRKG